MNGRTFSKKNRRVMFKKILTSLFFLCFTFNAGIVLGAISDGDDCSDNICHRLKNYAVLSNQATLVNGDTILWNSTPSGAISDQITVGALGHVKFHKNGLY